MKKILCIVLVVCSLLFCSYSCGTAQAASPFIETTDLDVRINEYFTLLSKDEDLVKRQELAHLMAECARALGYDEECEIIKIAKADWHIAQTNIELNKINIDQWVKIYEEYPYATYVWLYLTKTLEYTPEVAAGIIGNMIAEVGGTTLNLQYWLYSYDGGFYYGLCQWGKTWFPEVRGMDLIFQCEYLANTIESQFEAFGKTFRNNYTYETFLESSSAEEAALAFAACYERCGQGSWYIRQTYAKTTFEYFVDGTLGQ